MATPRSTSSKSTKKTSVKSSAVRAESSVASEPSSKPLPRVKARESTSRIVTDFPTRRFKRGNSVVIKGEAHKIQGARIQGGTVLLKLEDIQDRDTAAALRGAEVEVPTQDAVSLPKGQFYWHQVIGLRVEDATSHEPLGEVTDIIETGANDVYIVRGPKAEILVPAIKDVVKNIDPTEGRMLIQPLPGMLPG